MEQEQNVGSCPLNLSRVSSNHSQLSLIRGFSHTSSNEEEMLKNIHQRFLKLETIIQSIEKLYKDLMELVALDKDLILLLLHKYQWKIDNLKEHYYNRDYEHYTLLQDKKNTWTKNRRIQHKECDVCKQPGYLFSNICNHTCCYKCWNDYLSFGVQNQRKCFFSCFSEGCQFPVFYSMILQIIKQKNLFLKNISIEYIQNTKSLAFCPGINCQYCFQDTSCLSKTIICIGCNISFCFKCTGEPHQPCTCKEASDWNLLTKREKCSQYWIKQNTKKCPHCNLAVQKTLGCDYILCACKNKFCYRCSQNWDQKHSSHFLCPYENQIKIDKQQTSEQIQYLNAYYNNFLLNDSRIKSFKCFRFDRLKQKINQYINLGDSQTMFILRGKEALLKMSAIVKWGEIYQYFNRGSLQLNQAQIHNLRSQISKCSDFFNQLDKKISKLFINNQFLQAPGSKIKDFYREKQQAQTLVRNMETSCKNYLKRINRQ